MGEFLLNLVQNPTRSFSLLFESHSTEDFTIGIKTEFHYMFLFSGGFLLFFRPYLLIMLVPIFLQKFYHDDYVRWGILTHYSIEVVPLIAIAAAEVYSNINNHKKAIGLGIALVILSYSLNISKLEDRVAKWHFPENINIYSKRHYTADYNVEEFHKVLDMIPADAPVSAHHVFVPHVTDRELVRLFPNIDDIRFIIYPLNINYWLHSKEDFEKMRLDLENSTKWKVLYKSSEIVLLEKDE